MTEIKCARSGAISVFISPTKGVPHEALPPPHHRSPVPVARRRQRARAGREGQKQAEIRKVTATSLERFYKADPKLKAEVAKAPGYAVFTTYGFSFVFGGAGGKGVAQDNKTKKVTYMEMGQASVGLQVGAAESETLFIFKTEKALQQFIDKGWEASGGGAVQAGAGGKSAGVAGGEQGTSDATYYTLTKTGSRSASPRPGRSTGRTRT